MNAAAPPVARTSRAALLRRRLRGRALAVLLLGMLCVGVAGFAELPAIHDGAHDLRHSHAFPCH